MRKHIWILGAYLLLSLVLTWPMAAQFDTHVPGDGIDDPSLAWNLWWVKHALVEQPQNPFACDWQFWPIGINLAFYTLTILNGLLSVPLQVTFGLIPAYNILLLLSFVLSGFGAYLLGVECSRKEEREKAMRGAERRPWSLFSPVTLSSFVGGLFYAFASTKMFYAALGQGNVASSQWVPFGVLYLVRAGQANGRARDAAFAALFLVLQAYAELTFASFLLVFAGFVVVWRLISQSLKVNSTKAAALTAIERARGGSGTQLLPQRRAARRVILSLLGRFVLLGGLFTLGISPVLANMLPDLRAEGDFFTAGGGFADLFSADLAAYAVPTQLHPVLGGVIRGWAHESAAQADGRQFAVDKGQHVYIGYVVLALTALAVWQGRRRTRVWFWGVAALAFFVLTLGPSLRVAGVDTGIPLPFRLFEQLPFFKGNRYPSRYSVMLLVSLVPLVVFGVRRLTAGSSLVPPRNSAGAGDPLSVTSAALVWSPVLIGLLLFEHLSLPLPTFNLANVPPLYASVAAEPGDFALLELPLGWRNGARVSGKQDILIMQQLWYQSSHGKRLLGGNTSRNPELKFQYFSEDPILAQLIAITNAADLPQHDALRAALAARPVTDDDRDAARAWADFRSIRLVMVHRDKIPAQAEVLLRDLLPLTLMAEEGNLALYRVSEPLAHPTLFLPGTDQGRSILGEGWSPPSSGRDSPVVYAQRRETRLLLPLPPAETIIHLDGQALAPSQRVTLVVDGRVVGTQPWPQEPARLRFVIPADPTRPLLSDVRLRFAHTISPAELAQQLSRSRPVGVLVRSAGQETGDFAHIFIDGIDRSPNARGYNLVAFDAADGTVLETASFDTHGDPAASAAMARWVAALPSGIAVAGAARDEAAMNLSPEATAALRSLGVAFDLSGRFRWGHAFIGRVGGARGTAIEAVDGVRPAQVQLGMAFSEPRLAAALERVEIVK